jgi:hypothetical protein
VWWRGREWIEALPASLERQAALLSRLLDLAEADRRFRAFEIQCPCCLFSRQ